ncbi:hypothetical protein POM88_050257 [Heracleum sosnowskyi]|uniref:Uncharacterized protein n=1 Tax=Heracleum sosnowskyi TaxID=360622 RepID=A0AAD8M1B4_9APIA|nr:hypothetical protein POM88_050257 [Heracleum sosnowskyi]
MDTCGCPSPKVAGRGCFGASLMLDADKFVAKAMSVIAANSDVRVSVKCRRVLITMIHILSYTLETIPDWVLDNLWRMSGWSSLLFIFRCVLYDFESKPWLVVPLILEAAARVPLLISENHLSMRRPSPYPPEVVEATDNSNLPESTCIKAMPVKFSFPDIYGDAILAFIGYTWMSTDILYEDVSLRSYYRILINKTLDGVYKLSREAILAAELPIAFATRSNCR